MKFNFEGMDARGYEVRDTIEAENYEDATAKIRQMGYFVCKIQVPKTDGEDSAVVAVSRKLVLNDLHWFLLGFVTASLLWIIFLVLNSTLKDV